MDYLLLLPLAVFIWVLIRCWRLESSMLEQNRRYLTTLPRSLGKKGSIPSLRFMLRRVVGGPLQALLSHSCRKTSATLYVLTTTQHGSVGTGIRLNCGCSLH